MSYSVTRLEELWSSGATYHEIATELGCGVKYVGELRRRHGLHVRSRKHVRREPDPTPQQIRERAAEIRERHMAEMRAMR